jgi:hypothetical protein
MALLGKLISCFFLVNLSSSAAATKLKLLKIHAEVSA